MRINDDALKRYAKLDGCTKKGSLSYKTSKDIKERWFVLKGNLLFFFKILNNYPFKTEQEPAGILVVEDCTVSLESSTYSQASFSITFKGEPKYLFYGSKTECEDWMSVIMLANMRAMKMQLQVLSAEIMRRTGQDPLKKILETRLKEISKQKAIGKSTFVQSAIVSQPVPGEISSSAWGSSQQSSIAAQNEPLQTYRPPMIKSSSKTPQSTVTQPAAAPLGLMSSTSAPSSFSLLHGVVPARTSQGQGHSLIQWDSNDSSVGDLLGLNLGGPVNSDNSWSFSDKPAVTAATATATAAAAAPFDPEPTKFQGWENFE